MLNFTFKFFVFTLILTSNLALSIKNKKKVKTNLVIQNKKNKNLKQELNENEINNIIQKSKEINNNVSKDEFNKENVYELLSILLTNLNSMESKLLESKKNKKNIKKEKTSFFSFLEEENKKNRLSRFIWAFILVIIFTVGLFFIVKNSVDWANMSRGELNKMKDQRMREITELLNNEFKTGI